MRTVGVWSAALWMLGTTVFAAAPAPAYRTYTGCCDASAAASLTPTLFATGSDEDNVLRVFDSTTGGSPVFSLNVSGFLGTGRRDEADLEAAARVDGVVYWIGSHSRNADGKARPSRHVFFGTETRTEGGRTVLVPVGRPYRTLVSDLARHPAAARYQLDAAASRAGEAAGGLNIEGLAAGPSGSVWIGFRNPVPEGQALLVPLLNPGEVIRGEAVRFGELVRVDLEGLGIRDMARAGEGYLILAGPAEGGGRHRLFEWAGPGVLAKEVGRAVPKGFQAEGLRVVEDAVPRVVELLGDEGGEKVAGQRCEDLLNESLRRFRGVRRAAGP